MGAVLPCCWRAVLPLPKVGAGGPWRSLKPDTALVAIAIHWVQSSPQCSAPAALRVPSWV